MKKKIILLILTFVFQIPLFSQDKHINLIITIDKEIVKSIGSAYFIIFDSIDNKSDSIRAYYYPGCLSLKENDFNRIIKDKNVIFYFTTVDSYYHIKYQKEWFFTTYSLLHIYNSNTKEYKKMTRDNDSSKYTYEFYSPEGFMLIRAKQR